VLATKSWSFRVWLLRNLIEFLLTGLFVVVTVVLSELVFHGSAVLSSIDGLPSALFGP